MSGYQLQPCDAADLKAEKSAYLDTLSAPLDGMWETFADIANHYQITKNDRPMGYCAVNEDRKLLQFYTDVTCDAAEAYNAAVESLDIQGAIVPTSDSLGLALALDFQHSISINALMYRFPASVPRPAAVFPEGTRFDVLDTLHLERAVAFAHETLGASKAWLDSYFSGLLVRNELFGLWQNDQIVATGECRLSDSQPLYADVGMVVGKKHRGQGLATNLLRKLVSVAENKGRIAICSTEQSNIGAQKAISRAGFLCQHRILEIDFQSG